MNVNRVLVAAARSLRNLLAPGMLRLFIGCLLLTLAGLAALTLGLAALAEHIAASRGWLADSAAQRAAAWGGPLLAGISAWFMFPLAMPVIVSFFDEYIADRIERHEYPKLAIGAPQPFWPDLRHDILFTLKALALNLLALPLYFLPPFNLFIYYLLNGYLLGNEFFVMAAGRHLGKPAARAFARKHRGTLLLAGVGIAFLATVPAANLIAPFWGVALMVHLYQMLANEGNTAGKQEVLPPLRPHGP